jgi:4-amino-4-deoxy-L-arabinose transferase-like glycosyltransferase
MHRRLKSLLIVLLIVVCAGLLYGHRLEYAPPHVEIDEVLIGLVAQSIASTGHDLRGEFLPLYSQTAEHSWYQPFVIYLTALALKVVHLSEWAVRLPTVGIGILNIALMYFVARHLFASDFFAAIAAGMLALTPAHFIHGRYGMDYIYPLPFILAWLLCLEVYNDRRRPWLLVAATGFLGIGFYSYIASMVMMPVYFILTYVLLFRQKAPRRSYWLAAAGFLPALAPFVVWLARHPTAYAATIEKYGLYDAKQLDAVQGLRSVFSYLSVSQRLSQYWDFFNPSFLFFGGGTKLMFSTNMVGVFLLPLALFLLLGIHRAVKHRDRPMYLIVLLGFATAPLAALIVAEENAIFRALPLLPFGVLLATIGVEYLWSAAIVKPRGPVYKPAGIVALAGGGAYAVWTLITQSRVTRSSLPLIAVGLGILLIGCVADRVKQWRIVAVCLLALMPIQFWYFWSDYFSDYRVRSSYWLGGNIRGALEEIIGREQRAHAPRVYFSTLKATSGQLDGRNPYMDAYWKFYLIKHNRQDLLARTMPFEPQNVQTVPSGSLVLANLGDTTTEALVAKGELKRVTTIPELNHNTFFVVLQR